MFNNIQKLPVLENILLPTKCLHMIIKLKGKVQLAKMWIPSSDMRGEWDVDP